MEPKYIAGPWSCSPAGDKWEIDSEGHAWASIADVCANDLGNAVVTPEQAEANARLIAAAPELLEACALAVATIERLNRHGSADGTLDVLRAALARAPYYQ